MFFESIFFQIFADGIDGIDGNLCNFAERIIKHTNDEQ